jgi:hypothetical protein
MDQILIVVTGAVITVGALIAINDTVKALGNLWKWWRGR